MKVEIITFVLQLRVESVVAYDECQIQVICLVIQISLGLYKDDSGVLRCSSRIQNSLLPYSTKCPVLLSKKHYITRLVILDCHEKVFHNKLLMNHLHS